VVRDVGLGASVVGEPGSFVDVGLGDSVSVGLGDSVSVALGESVDVRVVDAGGVRVGPRVGVANVRVGPAVSERVGVGRLIGPLPPHAVSKAAANSTAPAASSEDCPLFVTFQRLQTVGTPPTARSDDPTIGREDRLTKGDNRGEQRRRQERGDHDRLPIRVVLRQFRVGLTPEISFACLLITFGLGVRLPRLGHLLPAKCAASSDPLIFSGGGSPAQGEDAIANAEKDSLVRLTTGPPRADGSERCFCGPTCAGWSARPPGERHLAPPVA
jgi:hypothetical protein